MADIQSLDSLFNRSLFAFESFEESVVDTVYKISKMLDNSSKDTVYVLSLKDYDGVFFNKKRRLMKLKCFKELKRLYKIKGQSCLSKDKLLLQSS